jgi:hypothetical protein
MENGNYSNAFGVKRGEIGFEVGCELISLELEVREFAEFMANGQFFIQLYWEVQLCCGKASCV